MMKKSYKIIILISVVAIAIAIIIISSLNRRKKSNSVNQIASNAVENSIENKVKEDNGNDKNSTENEYVKISYEQTKQEFKVSGSQYTITVFQDYPKKVISSNQSVQNIIQEELGKIANEQFSEYKKIVQDRMKDPDLINADFMELHGNLSIGWSLSNSRNDDKVISVVSKSSGSLGGATWDEIRGYSFSAEDGNILTINEISINPNASKKYINSEIVKYLRANYQNLGIYSETYDKLSDSINIDNMIWYFSEKGLNVCFKKYQVSPNAFEYTISYSNLKDLIKPEYLK